MNEIIKILYVEDDAEIRDELVEILELDYRHIFVASNGEEGLELFDKHHPDVVISDIQMPKMDGLTMCKMIREKGHDIPIIMTTAFNELDYRNQADKYCVAQFVTKPIDMKSLYSALDSCISLIK